jgi:hypothetical protein
VAALAAEREECGQQQEQTGSSHLVEKCGKKEFKEFRSKQKFNIGSGNALSRVWQTILSITSLA